LGSLAPRDAHQKATKARRGHGLPYRPERRLVTTEAARARVAAGFRRVEQRHLTGPRDGLELSKEDLKILSLRNRGLWPSEIASRLGIPVRSVLWRFERLRRKGFTLSSPTGARPNANRKVTDEEILACVRSRLSMPEIAAKVGITTPTVHKRIKRLQKWD
jgi:Winged helix-turn-helix DNA-binding